MSPSLEQIFTLIESDFAIEIALTKYTQKSASMMHICKNNDQCQITLVSFSLKMVPGTRFYPIFLRVPGVREPFSRHHITLCLSRSEDGSLTPFYALRWLIPWPA